MKHLSRVLLFTIFLAALAGCDEPKDELIVPEDDATLNSLEDSVAYFLGMNLSTQFKYFNQEDFRPDMLEKGVIHGTENKFILTSEEKKSALTDYFKWAQTHYADSVLRRSEAFLAKNRARPEVKETLRGLQYEVLEKGSGTKSPDGNDLVKANYKQGTALKGVLIDPTENQLNNDTAVIVLNAMYSGVSEAFQMMRPGDKWRVWVHPKIGSSEGEDLLKVVESNEVLYAEINFFNFIPRLHENLTKEDLSKPGFFLDESKRYE